MKNIVRLTEGDLQRIVSRVINEIKYSRETDYRGGSNNEYLNDAPDEAEYNRRLKALQQVQKNDAEELYGYSNSNSRPTLNGESPRDKYVGGETQSNLSQFHREARRRSTIKK